MRKGQISIYYGAGKGKTSAAVGLGLRAIGEELRVVMIQFLDYYNGKETGILQKLEPDFRFEKSRSEEALQEAEINEAMKKEIAAEIRNAFNFAKKIVDTAECEMLMLDGVLECVEKGYLPEAELADLLDKAPENMDLILTGTVLPEGIAAKAGAIYQIKAEK